MRATLGQLAVVLLCGEELPLSNRRTLAERIVEGRRLLVQITGRDYGFDPRRWHEHLKETGQGGYSWRSDHVVPRVLQEALASEEWQRVVARLEGQTVH